MGDNVSLEPLFNDKVSDPNGLKRDLRVKNALQPLEGYHISDEEMGATSYYGYLNKDGAWYIQRSIRTGGEVNHTYKKGSSGYTWADRAVDDYASFDTTF